MIQFRLGGRTFQKTKIKTSGGGFVRCSSVTTRPSTDPKEPCLAKGTRAQRSTSRYVSVLGGFLLLQTSDEECLRQLRQQSRQSLL